MSLESIGPDFISTLDAKDEVKLESIAEPDKQEEVNETFDGWTLSHRLNVPPGPIRYYCSLIDTDYSHHCITVSAHMSNLYNSFAVR